MGYALMSGIGVYFGSGVGVALECATEVALEWVANVQINTAISFQSGNGVVGMEWQRSVHSIATPANF